MNKLTISLALTFILASIIFSAGLGSAITWGGGTNGNWANTSYIQAGSMSNYFYNYSDLNQSHRMAGPGGTSPISFLNITNSITSSPTSYIRINQTMIAKSVSGSDEGALQNFEVNISICAGGSCNTYSNWIQSTGYSGCGTSVQNYQGSANNVTAISIPGGDSSYNITISTKYVGACWEASRPFDNYHKINGIYITNSSGDAIIELTQPSDANTITLNSPSNAYISPSTSVTFNASADITGSGQTLTNMSLYIDGVRNTTNVITGTVNTTTFTNTLTNGQSYNWSVQACASDGTCGFSENRSLTIDSTAPTLSINAPTGTINYGYTGQNVTLNATITDSNLASCWFNYNDTNNSFSCTSGVPAISSFIKTSQNNLTLYANDTAGNVASQLFSWGYTYYENSRTFNAIDYETASSTFSLNLTGATSVALNYNGTSYSTTKSGDIYSTSIVLPTSTGTKNVYWTIDGATDTYTSTQTLVPISFGLCNTTLTNPYINFTFKEETLAQASTNASFSSTWTYYLGDGTINKTLAFTNSTANRAYAFCFNPQNQTLYAVPSITYYNPTSIQRTYSPGTLTLTNVTTNTTLWLLPTTDGIYVSFQVINSAQQPIEGVQVEISRSGIGTLEAKTTDDSGIATFWMNPNYAYTIDATKTGYSDFSTTITPTQSSYTIDMGSGGIAEAFELSDYDLGIVYSIKPGVSYLSNGTTYNFNFTLSSSYWDVTQFGFTLKDFNGNTIGSTSESTNGGIADLNLNVGSNSTIRMDYYWIIEGNYTNGSRTWTVFDDSETAYSINSFKNRLLSYLDGGIFGLTPFSLNIIVFVIIMMVTGFALYKFGMDNPVMVSGVLLALVVFFDAILGLITYMSPLPNYTATIATALLFIGAVIREATQ